MAARADREEQARTVRRLFAITAVLAIGALASASLLLAQVIGRFGRTVDAARTWSARVDGLGTLGAAVHAVGTPGDDVFETGDVDGARRDLRTARLSFDQLVAVQERELASIEGASARDAAAVAEQLQRLVRSVDRVEQLASSTLDAHAAGDLGRAGTAMAATDHALGDAQRMLADVTAASLAAQQRALDREHAAASRIRVQSFPLTLAAILTIAALLAVIRATDARTRRAAQEREAMLRVLQRSAAELHANNRRLAESNRDLTDFAYVASHDLQEPLRKITAFGERLRVRCGDRLGDDGRDYLARMTSASTRMGHLIDDLLTYSRITTRGAAFVATDVGSIARGVLSDLEVAIERAGATVELGPLATIEADPTQLRQLLQNLVGNALKFRRHDVTPFVSVSMERVEAPEAAALDAGLPGAGGWWRLEVRDNGIGFDPRDSERIFSLFQRLHARSSDPGSGIGLTVCRRIVERHHGEIRAFGTPGSGATFRVVLPSVQPRDNGDASDDVTTDELELPAELLFTRVLQPA